MKKPKKGDKILIKDFVAQGLPNDLKKLQTDLGYLTISAVTEGRELTLITVDMGYKAWEFEYLN